MKDIPTTIHIDENKPDMFFARVDEDFAEVEIPVLKCEGRTQASQLAASIAVASGSVVSNRLVASIAAECGSPVSRRLAVSHLRTANLPIPWLKWPLDVQPDGVLKSTSRAICSPQKLTSQPGLEVVDIENPALSTESLDWLTLFDVLVKDSKLRLACRNLFMGGHYALAVQKAYTCIDNIVREESGYTDKYGADLMRAAFSPKNPVLRLNKLEALSDRNEQQGYMDIFAGTMLGIRNPRAHEYSLDDPPREALDMMVMANHLMQKLNGATPD